eukprot:scaffold185172_cov31-Prasinocladus_malaysianus.AAC.1
MQARDLVVTFLPSGSSFANPKSPMQAVPSLKSRMFREVMSPWTMGGLVPYKHSEHTSNGEACSNKQCPLTAGFYNLTGILGATYKDWHPFTTLCKAKKGKGHRRTAIRQLKHPLVFLQTFISLQPAKLGLARS